MKPSVYNKYGLLVWIAALAFSVIYVGKLLIFDRRIDLGEEPGLPEETAAAADATAPPDPAGSGEISEASGGETQEPWLASEELIRRGEALYKTHCAVCHGPKGLGDGTPGLKPPPRNLVTGEWKRGGSAQNLFITLQKGFEGTSMIPYKHLSKTDRWALVHYIQSITKNKITDEPEALEAFGKTAE